MTNQLRIMNAAGWCKDVATVKKLAKTPVTEIAVGSITVGERAGNTGTVFWESPARSYALNSLGLPNPGIEKFLAMLPEMRAIAHDAGKRLRVSIAGFDPNEYVTLARMVRPFADTTELNLGCPNVWSEGTQKVIVSHEPKLMKDILSAISAMLRIEWSLPWHHIAVKLSPYSDPRMMGSVIELLSSDIGKSVVAEVVTCNTFPNCYGFEADGKSAITPAYGFAGLSGTALKGIALGQVRMFANGLQHLGVDVIGVGGISSGLDVLDMYRAGARGVQIGTHYFSRGEKVFQEIIGEYADLV